MKDIKKGDYENKNRTEWQDFLWKKFLEKFSSAESYKAVNAIFSDYEKHLVAKRLAALALIKEGVTTKEIEQLLWLSRATISALKKSFINSSYNSPRSFQRSRKNSNLILSESSNTDWLSDLFNGIDLWELIKNPPRPSGMGIKRKRV